MIRGKSTLSASFRRCLLLLSALVLTAPAVAQETATLSQSSIPVYTGKVHREKIEKKLSLRGRVIGRNTVDITSILPGTLIELLADESDRVVSGQMVAMVERIEPGLQFEPVRVESPVSGVVVKRYLTPGSQVTPQTPIIRVLDDSTLIFRADLLEKDLGRIRKGLPALIRLVSGYDFRSRIQRIGPEVGPGDTVPVDFTLPLGDKPVLPGNSGEVSVFLEVKDVLTIPQDALLEKSRETGVFVVRNGIVHWEPVSVVEEHGDRLEVTADGIQSGEKVVTLGKGLIRDGVRVEIREDIR